MSVEAMTMVTVTGPENMVDTAIRRLVLGRQFHPENAIEHMASFKKLSPFDSANPYSEALSASVETMKLLKLRPDYRDFSGHSWDIEEAAGYVEGLRRRVLALNCERAELEEAERRQAVVAEQLEHFSGFDVELASLLNMRYVKLRFGRLPEEEYKNVCSWVDERADVFYIPSVTSDHWIYGGYFVLLDNYNQVDAMFSSMGFERTHLDVAGDMNRPVGEVMEGIVRERGNTLRRLEELAEEKKALCGEKEKLLETYSWLRFMSEAFELRAFAGRRHARFYLVGWVPTATAKEFAAECEGFKGFSCAIASSREGSASPPVKLKKGFLSGIYEPFVEMYGLPRRGEFDPRLFMGITYTLLFGIMFGDVGQGALLVAVGALLWKLKGMWLGRIVSLCGVSAIIFGFVYGSVFGNEELLPGFKVLEDGNTMKILLVAVAVGVILILICMILNIITGIRQKDIKKIFFEPNGLAGFVLYGAIAYGVVSMALMGTNVFSTAYVLLLVVLPVFLIFAAVPLTKLLTGQKDWLPKSIGMFIVEGFFELFETALSYVSNTVSFLRVGAFAISHAGMMMVVYLLSSGSGGGYSIPGLIFGNLLVTGLETVLVCIQVMRLEFYEMFGRFYTSGGQKYSPRTVDYKTV